MLDEAQAEAHRARARWRRQTDVLLVGALILTDLVTITTSTFIALVGRQNVAIFGNSAGDLDAIVRPLAGTIALAWVASIALAGAYSAKQIGAGTVEYRRVLGATAATMGVLGIAAYLFSYPMSRGFYFLVFVVGIPMILLGRLAFRRLLHTMRRHGRMMASVLVAGDLDHIDDVAAVLNRERWLGYQVVGALAADTTQDETSHGIPIFGSPDDAVAILLETGANAVVFAEGSFRKGRHFNQMARALEDSKARMIVVPALTDISAARMDIRPVAGIPLVHVEPPRARAAGRTFKRAFDLIGSTLIMIFLSPVIVGVAIAIRVGSPGPIFFRQVRAGLKGEPFECLKFRSMVVDAEARLAQLQHLNKSDGVLFKIEKDPRVTNVGRFIRRYSLDELPQLFNVWLGDMSLVGPRPALTSEVRRY